MQLWPRFRPHNGCFIKYSEPALEPPSPLCCSLPVSWTDGFAVYRNSSSFALPGIVRDVGFPSCSLIMFLDVSHTLIIPAFQCKRLQTPLLLLTFVCFAPGFGKHLDKQETLLFSSPPDRDAERSVCARWCLWFEDKDVGEISSPALENAPRSQFFKVQKATDCRMPPFGSMHIVQLHYNY